MATSAQQIMAGQGDQVDEEEKRIKRPKKKKLSAAERKERKLKAERDFKMLEMRDQLKREYEMSKRTARKYRERWEDMCRQVKLKQMKQELEDWENQVERVLKQKDRKIELLLDEMATTQNIQRKSFSTITQMMDYLIDILKTFQRTSYLWYENEASDLLHDFYREVEERNAHETDVKVNCESVAHATGLLSEKELLSDYEIFLDKRDDCVQGEIEKRYRLRDRILKEMKSLREQLLEFLNSLKSVSLDVQKYEKINSLMERQKMFETESVKLNDAEERSSRIYADVQKELAQEEKDVKIKLNDLQVQYKFFMKLRKTTENEMQFNRQETYEKLTIVTSESFEVIKKFQKLQKFGELLLSLATSCRKLQTESEKVLPCGDFEEQKTEGSHEMTAFKLETIDLKSHVDISEKELQNNAQIMNNFWRRQALVEAQVMLLEEEKKNLLEENQNYIAAIKRLTKTDNAEDLLEALRVQKAGEY